ncbi:U5 snRNP complex subunit LIN1 [Kluyveromyces lactis]|uniref:KLLA0C02629p n=1 Tax=Kluyveromyces lactis (strain ATCC 8585 / CBS 2359 / DSM 70799 / NBRC 1267 / NRRL Y-1140 / WM37) TaxID=284590 RepID=Q6CUS5_KLULA|nr:uncharacterized protein KLLA0_C02629g [Kluyveromyces lactis]CAH01165.1 KLLA0C02629p [Kluyveromyces lactis]|eukprot:XP_452314.1 uncharacterized protein KLLA0_C02629g [Kluyveromyces lactis]
MNVNKGSSDQNDRSVITKSKDKLQVKKTDFNADSYDDHFEESDYQDISCSDDSSDNEEEIEDFVRRGQTETDEIFDGNSSEISESDSAVADDSVSEEEINGSNVQIEAFNMEEELKNGTVDKVGNATGKTINDDFENEDQWIQDFSSKESIKRAREAHENSQTLQRKKRARMLYRLEEVLEQLYYFVPRGKTIQEALILLQQLRKSLPKEHKERTKYIANAIQIILTLVNVLEQKGIDNPMQLQKEGIRELYDEENLMGSTIDDVESKNWVFKWFADFETAHESFSNYEMQTWKEKYFNSSVVVKRKCDTDETDHWYHVDCIYFM